MSLQEHDNNQYTKEKDEVEKYLLRIIQRYFDIENNYTKESIEAIIVESLTRFKQIVIKEKGFIFSLNQKTGHLVLTIKDFGGEYAFDKNTAFNKDFGNAEGDVCEGNDIRLENPRDPLEHSHEIADVQYLAEKLNMSLDNLHTHDNQPLLDMLTYTGTQAYIDLTVLDTIKQGINDTNSALQAYRDELGTYQQQLANVLPTYIPILEYEISRAQEMIRTGINWLDEAKAYAKSSVHTFHNDMLRKLLKYANGDDVTKVNDFLNNITSIGASNDIALTRGTMEYVSVDGGTSINEKFHQIQRIGSLANKRVKFTFRYDNNGKTIEVPLPYHYSTEDGKFGIIQGGYSQNGDVVITSIFCTYLPARVTAANMYNTNTLIGACTKKKTYDDMIEFLNQNHTSLSLLDSQAKNNFVKQLIDTKGYFIQGKKYEVDDDPIDDENNILSFTDWDTDEPNYEGIENIFYLNSNKKWAVVPNRYGSTYGAIFEYSMKYLNDYFTNPRVHYTVLE